MYKTDKEFNDLLMLFLMAITPIISNDILSDYDFFKSGSTLNIQKFNLNGLTVQNIKEGSIMGMMRSVGFHDYDPKEYIEALSSSVNFAHKKTNFDKQRVVIIVTLFTSFLLVHLHQLYGKKYNEDYLQTIIDKQLEENNLKGLIDIHVDENRKKNGGLFMRVQLGVIGLLSLPILYYAYSISILHWSGWIILLVFSTICHNFIFKLLNTVGGSMLQALLSMCIVTIPFSFVFYYLSKWLLSGIYVVGTFGGGGILMSGAVHAGIVILVSLVLGGILAFRDAINK